MIYLSTLVPEEGAGRADDLNPWAVRSVLSPGGPQLSAAVVNSNSEDELAEALAERFGVSRQAMHIRLINLGLIAAP